MAIETRISNETYERLAHAEPDRKWELQDGVLREKPGKTFEHNWLAVKLAYQLMQQLDWSVYQARVNSGRVHRPGATYFIPDVFVLRTEDASSLRDRDDILEVYDRPLPLVVEIWSRSTGVYDVQEKLKVYKARGDLEIWHIHPYERTLTAWRRLSDGRYDQEVYKEGIVRPAALPGVAVDLAELFRS